jgi:hypothetical protein
VKREGYIGSGSASRSVDASMGRALNGPTQDSRLFQQLGELESDALSEGGENLLAFLKQDRYFLQPIPLTPSSICMLVSSLRRA